LDTTEQWCNTVRTATAIIKSLASAQTEKQTQQNCQTVGIAVFQQSLYAIKA